MKLEQLRAEIDNIDDKIIQLLDSRLELTREVGKVKKQEHVEILDNNREEEIYRKIIKNSKNKNDIIYIYEKIMHNSKLNQLITKNE